MKKIATLASLALLGICSATSAAEFWSGVPVDRFLTWHSFDSGSTRVSVTSSAGSYGGSGGQFKGYFHAGTAEADEFFRFFCIDLRDSANTGPHEYSASILHNNDPLARLFAIAYPRNDFGDFYDDGAATSFGHFSSAIDSSAFQLAVWEIYFEDDPQKDFSLADGNFRSNTVSGDAQKSVEMAGKWLDQINSGAGSATGWTLYKFSNGSHQDYLSATYTKVPEQTENSVPEPGTLAMFGLGIAALGAIRRRRR